MFLSSLENMWRQVSPTQIGNNIQAEDNDSDWSRLRTKANAAATQKLMSVFCHQRGGEDYTEVNIIRKTVKEMREYSF
jgi:hypothetical protein